MAANSNHNDSDSNSNDNNSPLSSLTSDLLEAANGAIMNATAILAGNLPGVTTNTNDTDTDDHATNVSLSNSSSSSDLSSSTQIPQDLSPDVDHSLVAIIFLSLLFFVIVLVGIIGNALVIFVVLTDRKMRQSVTNLLILNLAVADLVIMALGVPEIVQFMLDRGWLLGSLPCRLDRFLLVVCLYSSVLSLVSVCFERFVAIVFPIKAHVVCTRRKVLYVIAVIWPVSILCGLPTVIFNQLADFPSAPGKLHCLIIFPDPHLRHFLIFKLLESAFFYFVPLVVQVALYAVVARRLFASMEELHTRFQMRSGDSSSAALNGGGGELRNGGWSGGGGGGGGGSERGSDRAVETIRARKGVVKMLVASVVVYTVSYSPHQAHLLYNTFSPAPLPESWNFFVFVMVMTHINSAANPVLYSIFSQNFRRNFKRCLCYICYVKNRHEYRRTRFDSFDSRGVSRRASTTRTTVSRV